MKLIFGIFLAVVSSWLILVGVYFGVDASLVAVLGRGSYLRYAFEPWQSAIAGFALASLGGNVAGVIAVFGSSSGVDE